MNESKRTYDDLIDEIKDLRSRLAAATEHKSLFQRGAMIFTESGTQDDSPTMAVDSLDSFYRFVATSVSSAAFQIDLKSGNIKFSRCDDRLLPDTSRIHAVGELISTISSRIHPEDLATFDEMFRSAQESSSAESTEVFVKLGTTNHYDLYRCLFLTPKRDWLGKPKELTLIISKCCEHQDHTDSEEKFFKTLFNQASIGMSIVDLDGKIIAANPAVAKCFEYTPADLEVLNIADISDPNDYRREKELIANVVRGYTNGYQIEKRYFAKSGKIVWARLNATLFESDTTGERFMLRIIEDITAAKATELQLKKNEKIYSDVFNSISDGIIVHDPYSGQIFDANASSQRMYGYTREEFVLLTIADVSANEEPYSATEAQSLMQRSILIGPQVFEWRCKRKSGELFWAEVSLLTTKADNTYRTQAVIRDTTERREHDKAMRMVQFSVDKAGDSIIWINKHSRILYTNEVAERVYGFPRKDLLSMSISDIDFNFRPETWIRQLARVRDVGYIEYETLHKTRFGTTFPVEVKGHYMNFEGEEGIFAIIRDVSQKKHAEEQQRIYLSRLERVVEIISALLKSGTIEEISEMSLRKIVAMTSCVRASIELYDFHSEIVTRLQFDRTTPDIGLSKYLVAHDSSYIPPEVYRGEPVYYSDISALDSVPQAFEQLISEGIRSMAFLPIMADSRLIGALVMYDDQKNAFTIGRAEIFTELAASLSLALKQIRLQEQISQNTQKLEENIKNLSFSRFALENAGEGVLWFDSAGRIFYANDSVCKMLGHDQSDIMHSLITNIDPSFKLGDIEDRVRSAESGNYWLRESEIRTSDDRVIPAEIASTYFDYEGNGYFIEFIRDISERKQSELALLRSEETYRIIVEQTASIVFDMNLVSNEIKWSGPKTEITGWESDDFPNHSLQNWLDLVHPDDRDMLSQKLDEARYEHKRISTEYRIRSKSGEYIYFEMSCALIQNAAGEYYRLLGSQRDITARIEAQNELKRYTTRLEKLYELDRRIISGEDIEAIADLATVQLRELIGSDRASILVVDSNNEIATLLAVSEKVPSSLPKGYSTHVDRVFTPYHRQSNEIQCFENLETNQTKTPYQFEMLGNGIISYATIPIFIDDKYFGSISIGFYKPRTFTTTEFDFSKSMATSLAIAFQNNNYRKQIESYTSELESRVQERTIKLESANKELEAFSYSVSHDLRAPLRAIDGFAQALFEDYAPDLDSTGKDYIKRIRNASQRMAALIDDMLKLSRVTRHEIAEVDVNLSDIAHGIANELKANCPERTISISIQPELTDLADPQLMNIALTNLFENAFKFTSKKEISNICFGCTTESGRRIYFVKDNGAGFDMKYAGKLFGAFQRLHKAEDYPGTGIGLATVQRIISKHGGRIWAESTPNIGTTFFFSLHYIANGDTQ